MVTATTVFVVVTLQIVVVTIEIITRTVWFAEAMLTNRLVEATKSFSPCKTFLNPPKITQNNQRLPKFKSC